MGIDFMIGKPCEPKEQLGADGIIAMLKARDRGQHVAGLMRKGGDERPLSEISFVTAVYRSDGQMDEQQVSVQSLLDQAKPLDDHAAHCEGCSANVAGEPYGCRGYISYPIQEATERWLLDRLPDDLNTTAGFLLTEATSDLGLDGERAKGLRSDGEVFFEKQTATGVRWGDGEEGFMFQADQMFDMFFGLGALKPSHMAMLALFMGILPHDLDHERFGPIMRDPHALAGAMNLGSLEVDGQSVQIQAVAHFLRAMCSAAVHGVELSVDS